MCEILLSKSVIREPNTLRLVLINRERVYRIVFHLSYPISYGNDYKNVSRDEYALRGMCR